MLDVQSHTWFASSRQSFFGETKVSRKVDWQWWVAASVGLYGWMLCLSTHRSGFKHWYIYICYIGFFFTTCRHGLLFFSIEDFSNPRKLGTLRNQSCWGIIFQDTVRSQRWLPRLMRTNLEPQGARGVSHLVLPKKRLGYAVCGRYKIGTIPVYHPMPQKNQNYQLYKSLNG